MASCFSQADLGDPVSLGALSQAPIAGNAWIDHFRLGTDKTSEALLQTASMFSTRRRRGAEFTRRSSRRVRSAFSAGSVSDSDFFKRWKLSTLPSGSPAEGR